MCAPLHVCWRSWFSSSHVAGQEHSRKINRRGEEAIKLNNRPLGLFRSRLPKAPFGFLTFASVFRRIGVNRSPYSSRFLSRTRFALRQDASVVAIPRLSNSAEFPKKCWITISFSRAINRVLTYAPNNFNEGRILMSRETSRHPDSLNASSGTMANTTSASCNRPIEQTGLAF